MSETHAPPIQVLVMDVGGVLCRWLPERRLSALAAISDLPPATIDAQLFGSGWDDACERGQFELPEILDHLRSFLGLEPGPHSDAILRAAWASAFEPDASALGLMPWVRCRTAVFTNNGPLLEDALAHELQRVGDAFDERLFSWRLRATKPDPDAFAAATAQLAVGADEIFFVDDSPGNVEAATECGWRAHRYTDALNLRVALGHADLLPGPT